MTDHAEAGPNSRNLCDSLLAEMLALHPGVTRDELGRGCAFYQPGNRRFAYVFHSPEAHVHVFVRRAVAFDASSLPEGVGVSFPGVDGDFTGFRRGARPGEGPSEAERGVNRKKGPKTIRFSLKLAAPAAVRGVAKVLSDVAYPLSLKKSKQPKGITRPANSPPEEVLLSPTFSEGTVQRIAVNRYERDPRAREACIAHYGAVCCVCGFDFAAAYGEVMAGFTHVHHLKPLSTVGDGYVVDPVQDLRPVCPNCHAVIHRREPPYSVEEVQQLLR